MGKAYILTGSMNTFCVSELLQTKKFWLVPLKDGINYDLYAKDVFKLEICEPEKVK